MTDEEEIGADVGGAAEDWAALVAQINTCRRRLDEKPQRFRLTFEASVGGVLNAYREGDLSFDEAVRLLRLDAVALLHQRRRERRRERTR